MSGETERSRTDSAGHSSYVRYRISALRLFRLLADVGQDTAVNVEHLSVDEVRSVGGKEYDRTHQVFGRSPAGCGSLGHDEGIERMA